MTPGQRRAAKTRKREGKQPAWRSSRVAVVRLREGASGPVDAQGRFFMGSSYCGSSMCSRRGIDHLMTPYPQDTFTPTSPAGSTATD